MDIYFVFIWLSKSRQMWDCRSANLLVLALFRAFFTILTLFSPSKLFVCASVRRANSRNSSMDERCNAAAAADAAEYFVYSICSEGLKQRKWHISVADFSLKLIFVSHKYIVNGNVKQILIEWHRLFDSQNVSSAAAEFTITSFRP